jgi:hypothetical protein
VLDAVALTPSPPAPTAAPPVPDVALEPPVLLAPEVVLAGGPPERRRRRWGVNARLPRRFARGVVPCGRDAIVSRGGFAWKG